MLKARGIIFLIILCVLAIVLGIGLVNLVDRKINEKYYLKTPKVSDGFVYGSTTAKNGFSLLSEDGATAYIVTRISSVKESPRGAIIGTQTIAKNGELLNKEFLAIPEKRFPFYLSKTKSSEMFSSDDQKELKEIGSKQTAINEFEKIIGKTIVLTLVIKKPSDGEPPKELEPYYKCNEAFYLQVNGQFTRENCTPLVVEMLANVN